MFGIKKNVNEISVLIDGMTCQHCSARVEKALNSISGIKAKVNLEEKKANLTCKKEVSDETIKKCIEDIGYTVTEIIR